MVHAAGVSWKGHEATKHMWKEEIILTTARARTSNSREPNMTRITLLRLNTAYALEPQTAVLQERGKQRRN